jgi:hypothetical protein
VDKNRLAVELCKVSLWLEAHNPGEPLNFLDHHIKWGDAIVGLAHKEELENGIADEAFKKMPDDDKDIRAELAKRNKRERKDRKQRHFDFGKTVEGSFADISIMFDRFNRLPESTIEEIEHKRKEYVKMISWAKWRRLKTLADIQVAQFFIPKDEANAKKIVTDEEYMDYLSGTKGVHGLKAGKAGGIAGKKRFFHWFLEFPEVFTPSPAGEGRGEGKGGFDCILGNPPFLGNKKLTGNFGESFVEWLKFEFKPIGVVDLVTYFFRRAHSILNLSGFLGLISTNTISQGLARTGGLKNLLEQNATITFAVPSIRWPGQAVLEVSLVAISKGYFSGAPILANKPVKFIDSLLNEADKETVTYKLKRNQGRSFIGTVISGSGFILDNDEASRLMRNPLNDECISNYLVGYDLNNNPSQLPARKIINFHGYSINKAEEFEDLIEIVRVRVKPVRDKLKRKSYRERWWQFAERCANLYSATSRFKQVLVTARISKTHAFVFVDNNAIFADGLVVIAFDSFAMFSILQSSIHEAWAWKYCTTMKTDMNYGPTRVFETFAFPILGRQKNTLEYIGREYHEFRRNLMFKTQNGLTKTYNLFNAPDLREFSNEDIMAISTLKARDFQKQYGKETINLWKHLKKTECTCTFNEAIRDVMHLHELHKQMDESIISVLFP